MAGHKNTCRKTNDVDLIPSSLNVHNIEITLLPSITLYAYATPQATIQPPRHKNNIFIAIITSLREKFSREKEKEQEKKRKKSRGRGKAREEEEEEGSKELKSKLFFLTLNGSAMIWFKGLKDDLIDSLEELCTNFSSHFTTWKRQPKFVASLSAVVQGKDITLRDYMERFTREVVEEMLLVDKVERTKTSSKKDKKRNSRKDLGETTLCILPSMHQEAKLFRSALPRNLWRPTLDIHGKSRKLIGWTSLNSVDSMSHDHETKDYIQLKDAIEDLINIRKLSRYTKVEGHQGQDNRKS
ncbi:hypothetical protein TSUD_93490 [Trifolium subterraneum]|uniref:Retrotransposon gag domain-containing protein n=1 Tax=Trifolium subterraneum TaxID=3900 RepID=A0A2Z6LTG7_TRISU|nr:hypothetical protein TSUD_93490 [Trifolium subterraneum]